MIFSELTVPLGFSDFTEMERGDLLAAIETAQAEGYTSTLQALVELLQILDEIQGEGGQIRFRVKPNHRLQ